MYHKSRSFGRALRLDVATDRLQLLIIVIGYYYYRTGDVTDPTKLLAKYSQTVDYVLHTLSPSGGKC